MYDKLKHLISEQLIEIDINKECIKLKFRKGIVGKDKNEDIEDNSLYFYGKYIHDNKLEAFATRELKKIFQSKNGDRLVLSFESGSITLLLPTSRADKPIMMEYHQERQPVLIWDKEGKVFTI